MDSCPCGSGLAYEACCAPFLSGDASAPTAEALMRSRYTAYTTGDIDYIRRTMHKSAIHTFDEEASRRWSRDSDWRGLEIRAVRQGGAKDQEGEVEFVATYVQDGEESFHHELATFKREGQKWYYVDGEYVGTKPYVRETPKVGRNDPCPCGSGRKYKKCCGAK